MVIKKVSMKMKMKIKMKMKLFMRMKMLMKMKIVDRHGKSRKQVHYMRKHVHTGAHSCRHVKTVADNRGRGRQMQ